VVDGFVDDLKVAQQMEMAVDLTMTNGAHWLTGVRSVDEDDGTFTIYESDGMEVKPTDYRRLYLIDIMSVRVTDTRYSHPSS